MTAPPGTAMDLAWWISIIGVPLIGAVFGVDFYIHRSAQTERDKAIAEKDREIETLHSRISQVSKEFYEYKVTAAMLFSTVTAMQEVKKEIQGALSRIEDKLDRIADRSARKDNH